MRPELSVLPMRMQRRPIDERGYPIPWFVTWVMPSVEGPMVDVPEGTPGSVPEFRAMDGRKWLSAIRESRCWVCGEPLGAFKTFVVGPMCGINRTTSEPPCHRDCAIWSARNCPFLARPHMERRQHDQLKELGTGVLGGVALDRNPGVTLLWTTKRFSVWAPRPNERLIRMGDPTDLIWFAEGRAATRAEVAASVAGGLPALMELAEAQQREEGVPAVQELEAQVAVFATTYYPVDEGSDDATTDATDSGDGGGQPPPTELERSPE